MSGSTVIPPRSARPAAPAADQVAVDRLDYHNAWLSLLLFPVSFLAAFLFLVIESVALTVLGYSAVAAVLRLVLSTDYLAAWPPRWLTVLSVVLAAVVYALPTVLVVRYGRAARRAGQPGEVPIVAGVLVLGLLPILVLMILSA